MVIFFILDQNKFKMLDWWVSNRTQFLNEIFFGIWSIFFFQNKVSKIFSGEHIIGAIWHRLVSNKAECITEFFNEIFFVSEKSKYEFFFSGENILLLLGAIWDRWLSTEWITEFLNEIFFGFASIYFQNKASKFFSCQHIGILQTRFWIDESRTGLSIFCHDKDFLPVEIFLQIFFFQLKISRPKVFFNGTKATIVFPTRRKI